MASEKRTTVRLWVATALTILLVIVVWKIIDFRMRPPPPPNLPETPTARP